MHSGLSVLHSLLLDMVIFLLTGIVNLFIYKVMKCSLIKDHVNLEGEALLVTRWWAVSSDYQSWQSIMQFHRVVDLLNGWDCSKGCIGSVWHTKGIINNNFVCRAHSQPPSYQENMANRVKRWLAVPDIHSHANGNVVFIHEMIVTIHFQHVQERDTSTLLLVDHLLRGPRHLENTMPDNDRN